jgi:hypothetical protein
MKIKSKVIISSIAILVIGTLFLCGYAPVKSGELIKVKSGLITFDPLNNGKLTFTSATLGEKKPLAVDKQEGNIQWMYFGSAVRRNSPVSVYEDSKAGLHLGIKSAKPKTWAGFFAMSSDDYSKVYHTVIHMPYRSLEEGEFSAGQYVQTSVIYPHINYVACVAEVSEDGVRWIVESGTGNASDVNDRHVLWADNSTLLPLKRDCTIVTDGDRKLKVYYDREIVYSAKNLNLQMPKPFNSYLEVQTTNSKQFLHGVFSNFSTSFDEDIKVVNVPKRGYVVLTASEGKSITAHSDTEGNAYLHTGGYNSPFNGTIAVYNERAQRVALTHQPTVLSGGDIYSAVSVTPLQKWLFNQ